jgi:glycine betaine catabolism B
MYVTLDHVEDIASHIKTFWFKPEYPVRYEAGQFIELTIHHDNPDERGVRRWFTLSSSPTDELLSITTKLADKPSSFKQHLFALKTGDSIIMSDTMGDFVLPKDKTVPLIFVAGGIGVTPIHSMVKYLHDTNQQRFTHLLYAAHNTDEIAFKDLFDSAVTKSLYITDKQLSSQDILSVTKQYSNPIVYLSGPEEMVEVFFAELKEAGVPGSRLVTDYFPGYAGAI